MVEAAPRFDRRADDHELRAPLGGDARDLVPEAAGPRAHDFPPHRDAVRVRHGGGRLEALLEACKLAVEVRIDRQFALEDSRRDQDDACAAVGGEPAREVERVLRLLPVEQGYHDGAVGDRARPAREAARAVVEQT